MLSILFVDEVIWLIEMFDISKLLGMWNCVILEVMYVMGLWVSELIEIKLGDLYLFIGLL